MFNNIRLNKKISNRYFGLLSAIAEIYHKKEHLNELDLISKINKIYIESKIVEITEVKDNEEYFTIKKGADNHVLRPAYVDSLTNKILIKGIAEVRK